VKKASGKQPHQMKKDGGKQPYLRPKLTVHGDLRAITTAKGSNRPEAGKPKTFSTGWPP
jgi:hypothetical protein